MTPHFRVHSFPRPLPTCCPTGGTQAGARGARWAGTHRDFSCRAQPIAPTHFLPPAEPAAPGCACWNSRGERGLMPTVSGPGGGPLGDQPRPQIAPEQQLVQRKETRRGHEVIAESSASARQAISVCGQHFSGYGLHKLSLALNPLPLASGLRRHRPALRSPCSYLLDQAIFQPPVTTLGTRQSSLSTSPCLRCGPSAVHSPGLQLFPLNASSDGNLTTSQRHFGEFLSTEYQS